jgi:hypothetical protein
VTVEVIDETARILQDLSAATSLSKAEAIGSHDLRSFRRWLFRSAEAAYLEPLSAQTARKGGRDERHRRRSGVDELGDPSRDLERESLRAP